MTETITTRSYLGTMLLGTIPIVGIILLVYWSQSKNVRESKRNMCKAYIIVQLVINYPVMILTALIV